jgi:hypothetical protein
MMATRTTISLDILKSRQLAEKLLAARTTRGVEDILRELPIVEYDAYQWDKSPTDGWQSGWLHWVPVGRDRGNAGRIQLAGEPYNPLAERLVNGMEAIIEMARQQELLSNPGASVPQSPREAVERYFDLPRLDLIPRISDKDRQKQIDACLRELRQSQSIGATGRIDDPIRKIEPRKCVARVGDAHVLAGRQGAGASRARRPAVR